MKELIWKLTRKINRRLRKKSGLYNDNFATRKNRKKELKGKYK